MISSVEISPGKLRLETNSIKRVDALRKRLAAARRGTTPLWLDQPLPALNGETPRQAARTKRGRAMLDLIIEECENSASRLLENEGFDFSRRRRELGLDEGNSPAAGGKRGLVPGPKAFRKWHTALSLRLSEVFSGAHLRSAP